MTETIQYLDSFICPSCQSPRLLPTREKIIICQNCLNGYKMIGQVPDFRPENSISFKKKMVSYKKGIKADIIVLLGQQKDHHVDIPLGHCVILGRRVAKGGLDETTFIGRPDLQNFISLNPESHRLIERCLSKTSTGTNTNDRIERQGLHHEKQYLGNFIRDPDFLLDEPSVSRSHAIIYQDDQGVHLIDLVSKNGTYVNGYEIERTRLKNNDMINLGTAGLRIQFS